MSSPANEDSVATLADLHRMETAIVASLDGMRQKSRRGEVAIMCLQVALTTLSGLLIWRFQSSVNAQISTQATALSTKMALSEEFYKRRLDVYTRLCGLMAALQDAAMRRVPLTDEAKAFYDWYKPNGLYESMGLIALTAEMWTESMAIAKGESTGESLGGLAKRIEEQMRSDLHVDELSAMGGLFSAKAQQAEAKTRLARSPNPVSP
jgi:hypothetical protein